MAPDQSRPVTQPLKQLGGVCVCVWDDLQALLNLLMCACHVRVACVCVCGGGGCRCSSTCSCRPPSTPSPSSSATTPLPSRPRPRTPRRLTPQHPAGGALSESTSRLGVYVETRRGYWDFRSRFRIPSPPMSPHRRGCGAAAASGSPSCSTRTPVVIAPYIGATRRAGPVASASSWRGASLPSPHTSPTRHAELTSLAPTLVQHATRSSPPQPPH